MDERDERFAEWDAAFASETGKSVEDLLDPGAAERRRSRLVAMQNAAGNPYYAHQLAMQAQGMNNSAYGLSAMYGQAANHQGLGSGLGGALLGNPSSGLFRQ